MDEKEKDDIEHVEHNELPAKRFIKINPFSFVMLIAGLILLTATITFFVLTTGEEKVVEVVKPQPTVGAEFKKLFDAYDEVKENYFEDVEEEKVVNGAINGMIEALGDPYSDYLDEKEAAKLNESISSSFEGIGAEIQERSGYIAVVSPIKNSPAEKAGLLPNDLITAVDGESLQGMSSSEAVLLIRGEKGTKVTLTIKRDGLDEPMDVDLVRDVIPIETVYAEMDKNGIGHIHITSFSEGTYDELMSAIKEMQEDGLKGLVMDVRQNPGGLLNAAIEISELFVDSGENLLQYEARNEKPQIFQSSDTEKIDIPVTVLIDDGSASASEIFAGALSESAGISLVGETTFGKGTVQTPKDLEDGSNLKLTTAKWLTPNGNWIHEKGIKPDYKVKYPDYAMLPFLDPSEKIEEGLVSKSVETAEKMLEAVGYDPGEVDGLFDAQTKAAVMQLQVDEELDVTGILTDETTLLLMDKLRDKIQKDDPQLKKAKQLINKELKAEKKKSKK